MISQPTANDENGRKHLDVPAVPTASKSEGEYKVGPGHPPREHQFKPGQSGNPKGAKRKTPTVAQDLKKALERALNKKVKLKQGEKERIVTMFTAGIEQLVAQFAKGDRHARRDILEYADKLGIDLKGQRTPQDETISTTNDKILEAHVLRQYDRVWSPTPVLAPPELLDDDPDDHKPERGAP